MDTNTVTLKKGTWFRMDHDGLAQLGEIVDFQRDESNPDLFWFKCIIHFKYNESQETNVEKLYSSQDFERFNRLELYEAEAGQEILSNATRMSVEEPERLRGIQELLRDMTEGINPLGMIDRDGERPIRAREIEDTETARDIRRPAQRRPRGQQDQAVDPSEETRPEPDYTRAFHFHDETDRTMEETVPFKTPLGSGDMKTILKLFMASPVESWRAIDTIVEETGHLIMTYANASTRQKIIQTKINFLVKHNWIDLEVKSLYELEFKDEKTKAIYLGGNYWAMQAETDNSIIGLAGRTHTKIDTVLIQNFKINKLEDSALSLEIGSKVLPTINPTDIDYFAEQGNEEVFCIATAEREFLVKKDINKSWEKALTYDYYLGGAIDPRVSVKEFNDVDSIRKLATIKEDAMVLEALAA